jgi:serine/threonine protein kinase
LRLAEGTLLGGGRYRLEGRLGAGGMASVWLAEDTVLGRRVAVKVISDTLAHDEGWLARFTREARAAASVSHPNVVEVFDFGVEEDRPYIVMAHLAGGSLKDRLAGEGALPDATRLARELLGALGRVHAAGILHRDVKPGNLLLDGEGRSHLTDFGIARPEDATAMTQTGVVLGTMRYMAPEVAGGDPASRESDLYAAGMVLREVAGEGEPEALARLIDALTQADPQRRPPSAAAALEALDGEPTAATRVLGDATTAATAPLRRSPRPAARTPDLRGLRDSPWFVPLAALAAIALVTIVVIAAASGGGSGSGAAAAPTPAPLSAPVGHQLDALDAAIDHAAR